MEMFSVYIQTHVQIKIHLKNVLEHTQKLPKSFKSLEFVRFYNFIHLLYSIYIKLWIT